MSELKFALRQLAKSPGFTAVAVLTLALGIGANLAVVSVVDAVFFRPLPGLAEPDRLVILGSTYRKEGFGPVSYPVYCDLRDHNTAFSQLSGFAETPFSFSADNSTERLLGEMVTGNYFRTLGVPMVAGRDFLPEEDEQTGRNPVVVISERLWRRHWNGDRGIIGKTVHLNDRAFTVIGVAGRAFRGCQLPNTHELWVPVHMQPEVQPTASDRTNDRAFDWLRLVGRLKPGSSVAQAGANLEWLSAQLSSAFPDRDKAHSYRALPYGPFPAVGKTAPRIFFAVLFGVAVAIVTVVCASVAGLFLARLLARRRDIAVRLALGASRGRIVRQTLAEALLVSAMGILLGLLFATQGSRFLLNQIPGGRGEPVAIDLSLDGHVAWFSVGLLLVSAVVIGVLPAWQSSGVSVLPALKAQEGSLTARRSGLRLALVTVQVSLCLPLLSSAGLLFRSLHLIAEVDLGARGDNLLLADLDPALNGYDLTRALHFYEQLVERVAELPGVEAASLGALPPFRSGGVAPGAVFGGRVAAESPVISGANLVAPEYFRTMNIPLLQGREFLSSDRKDTQPVAIINQTLAKALWPGQDALGQWLHIGNTNEAPKLVIAVARDSVYSDLVEDAKQTRPFYYLPVSQRSILAQSLYVRRAKGATALLPSIRAEVAALDPNLPLFHVTTLKATRDRSMSAQRIAMEVVTFSGALAIVLAMMGLYAVMRQEVISRTREIGIRLAVGAQRREVVSMIVRQGMRLALLGIGLGMIAAFALTRVIRNLLFGVSATDPLTFAVLLVVSCLVGLLACWLPARRASKIDPIIALRYE